MPKTQTTSVSQSSSPALDHRIETAAKRRARMRERLLEAIMKVYSERMADQAVTIEDVVRAAHVSRGTFYKYFQTLDEALLILGTELAMQFTKEGLPRYDILTASWQRVAVGIRAWLTRAIIDPRWAGFVTRIDVWPHLHLVRAHIANDLRRGKELGEFQYGTLESAIDLVIGISISGIYTLRQGVPDPSAYINSAIGISLASLGCSPDRCAEAIAFSHRHLLGYPGMSIKADST